VLEPASYDATLAIGNKLPPFLTHRSLPTPPQHTNTQ